MLQNLSKFIKEETSIRLNVVISETIGKIVANTLQNMHNNAEKLDVLQNNFIKFIFDLYDGKHGKSV